MLDHAIGQRDQALLAGLRAGPASVMRRIGWHSIDDFRGLRRDRIVRARRIKTADPREFLKTTS